MELELGYNLIANNHAAIQQSVTNKQHLLEFSDEWATTKLRNESEIISKGTTPTTLGRVFVERGIAFVKIESITDDGRIDTEKLAYIDEATHTLLKRSQLKANDILFSIAGALGRVATADTHMLPANTNQALAFIRLKANSQIDHGYLIHYLRSNEIQKHIEAIQVQAAQANLSLENIRDFKIKFPPLPEQRAIATVLSDVDALLAKLDALIAKKRDVKQAAMQQLLTGKQRLPGFSGEWEVKRLGDVGTFSKGKGIKKDDVASDGLPCIRYGEIYTRHNDYIKVFYSFISRQVANQSQCLRKGDLLFAGSGETAEEIGKCVAFLGDEEAYAGGDIVLFTPSDQDSMYLGYLMNNPSLTYQKARMGQGDAVVHISATNLAQLELRLPCPREQTAIAAVLSDMDVELAALEARRDKTRALKQGMMQELLTGRIRLL